jgi:hypothetical protein
VPNLWGAVFAPPNLAAIDPYDGLWIDTRPTYDPIHNARYAAVVPEHRVRHVEFTTSGFVARNEPIFSRTFGLRIFLGQVVAAASWERMYETPNDGSLARLDFYRFHLTSNLLGGFSRSVEIYPLMGLGLMKGTELHGAFDAGLDVRVYPRRPLVIALSSIASIFREGPVLFDSKVEAGVAYGRVELRGGLRSMYQYRAQSFFGPMASLIVRL